MKKSRIDEVNNKINRSKIVILYFSNTTCGACEAIRVGRNIDLLDLERNIKRYYEMLF